jgi:hypothetical protein
MDGYLTVSEQRTGEPRVLGNARWHEGVDMAIADAESRWRHLGRETTNGAVQVIALDCLRTIWRSLSAEEVDALVHQPEER